MKVRFQHTCGDDPEGFRARAAMLATDLSDSPPMLLRRAVTQWVREKPFLPTAADLIRIMRDLLEAQDRTAAYASAAPLRPGQTWANRACERQNRELAADPNGRQDVEWVVRDGSPQLRFKSDFDMPRRRPAEPEEPRAAPGDCIPKHEVAEANRLMRELRLRQRYRRDGSAYQLQPGDADPAGDPG